MKDSIELPRLLAIAQHLESQKWTPRDFDGALVQRRARAVSDATFADLSAALAAGADPIDLYVSYRRLALRMMHWLQAGSTRAIPPSRPACKKGCTHCCYAPVQMSVPEAIWMASRMRAWPQGDKFLGRCANSASKKGLGFDMACPLLLHGGACRAYDVRPLACVLHTSFDKASCARGEWKCLPSPRLELSASFAMLGACYHRAGLPTCTVDMATALPLATPEARKRWLAGEAVFAAASVAPDHDDKVALAVEPSIVRIQAGIIEELP